MENSGLQLTNLVARSATRNQIIKIGIGNGNNGGGEIVCASNIAYLIDLYFIIGRKEYYTKMVIIRWQR